MEIVGSIKSAYWRLKRWWQRAVGFLRQETIRKRLRILLWIILFLVIPGMTVMVLVGRWAYRQYKKRVAGTSAAELEAENRQLRARKWELEEQVRALDRNDSQAFIANLNKIYAAFDEEISRINANENLPPYAKAARIKDWENLRDIQIGRFLEPQK